MSWLSSPLLAVSSFWCLFGVSLSAKYCTETLECAGTSVNGSGVYCYGYEACAQSDINVTGTSYCDGKAACFAATLDVDGDLFCEGSDGCALADMTTTGNLYCGGYWACAGASPINTEGIIECPGEEGCRYSEIDSADDGIYCFGDYGCRSTKITGVSEVESRGYRSTYYADIDTEGVSDFSITFDGYYAGYQTQVYCAEGSTCSIDCDQSTACFGVTVYCYGTCDIDCDDSECDYECPTELDFTTEEYSDMHSIWNKQRESKELLRGKHKKEFSSLMKELNENKKNEDENKNRILQFNKYVENELQQWSEKYGLNIEEVKKNEVNNINNLNVIPSLKNSNNNNNNNNNNMLTLLIYVILSFSLIVNGVLICNKYQKNKNGQEYQLIN